MIVSILVMLEVKWKEPVLFLIGTKVFCFNPCYVGSKMESFLISFVLFFYYTVSILVMLEVKWKVLTQHVGELSTGCFNPCYVGSKMESI